VQTLWGFFFVQRYYQSVKATSGEYEMNANETKLAEAMQKCLPPAEYVNFLDGLQEVLDSGVPYNNSDRVMSAFAWFEAPQGEHYWLDYCDIQERHRDD
jgi:hypothetical protein